MYIELFNRIAIHTDLLTNSVSDSFPPQLIILFGDNATALLRLIPIGYFTASCHTPSSKYSTLSK